MPTVFAKKAEVGRQYLTNKGQLVSFVGVKNNKPFLSLIGKDGASLGQPFNVPEGFLLKEVATKAAPKKAPASKVSSKPKAEKPAKVAKADKLPKVGTGKIAPRVKLEGYNLRQNYRNRLSSFRIKECEAARKPYCSCRCGGVLHGKSHEAWLKKENELFVASKNGAITAQQVLDMIKSFGGKPKDSQTVKGDKKK